MDGRATPNRAALVAQSDRTVPFGTTPGERLTMARALALLFVAGGALVILTVVLPHAANTKDGGILATGALAIVVGGVLFQSGDRANVRALQILLALGALLITSCVVFGGDNASAYPFMYLWVSLYAYYFFDTRIAAALIGWSVLLYAIAFLLTDDTPVPGVHWLMATGTIVVGGLLIGRLTAAIRAQSADLATVSRMAGGLTGVEDFAQDTCESLRASSGADVVVFLELLPSGDGLHVTAMAGAPEAGMAFTGDPVRMGLERAFRLSEAVELVVGDPGRGLRRFDGHVAGLAQPILRDGKAAGVLAAAWTSPRRSLPERLRTSALLFAAEASLAMDRAERVSQDRERQALEINDNIVQGLVVAKYSAQRGDSEGAIRAIDETLGRARRLITDQLQSVSHGRGGTVRPGDLARSEGASVDAAGSPAPVAGAERD
jgi:GAF domain-containing protein